MSLNIWMLSHPDVTVNMVFCSEQVIISDCSWQNLVFRIGIIHGANCHIQRRFLWLYLLSYMDSNTVFIGDFNAVKGAHERISSCRPNYTVCQDFKDFIEATFFIEAPTTGLKFTWSGRRFMPRHVESILDRALYSEDFAKLWGSVHAHVLPHITSDHSPLILKCQNPTTQHQNFFKFLNMWILHPDFHEVVRNSWNQDYDTTCPIFRVMAKLKRLKHVLKDWNKNTFRKVDIMLADFQQELLEIQQIISRDGYTEDLFTKETQAQAKINVTLTKKSSFLQQKSRVKWLQDGDRNTTFFHNMLRYKRRHQNIESLIINGTMIHDDTVIVQHVVQFFTNLFASTCSSDNCLADIQALLDHLIYNSQNALLARIPDEEEIIAAVFDMDAESSPGPDGFTDKFFHSCWQIIKVDIIGAVRVFFQRSYLPSGCNASTLILIPKKDKISSVTDLRPIVLSNFFFKIISKVLATRLSMVAAVSVSQNQFGFIKGRSARISILCNGRTWGYFSCSRGVRQGDPLSLILFGIAGDALSKLFHNCVASGHLIPMKMSRSRQFPTHLLYADDILVFCKATAANALTIKKILDYYGDISGQICSMEKSHVFFAKGVSVRDRRSIVETLQFSTKSLPFVYLGVPICCGRIRESHLRAIHDRIINKFARWKGLHLSIAGRLCLIKSVIQSSLTHSMMVYRWPRALIKDLDQKCRNFLWSGDTKKRAVCPVSWDRVCTPWEEGGLGVRSFDNMNKSFLMKLAWKVIKGRDFGYDLLHDRFSLLKAPCGLRTFTNFWLDDWLGYSIAAKCGAPPYLRLSQSIADYFYDGVWHFTQNFINNFPEIVCDILLVPIGEEDDTRYWKPALHGEITAKLASSHHGNRHPSVRWGKWLWEPYIPIRRSIMCWRLIHNRLPTYDRLIRQGLIMPNFCIFCRNHQETAYHILWNCARVMLLWKEFFKWFNYEQAQIFLDTHSLLVDAWNRKLCPQIGVFWKAGIVTMLWLLWTTRNNYIFENKDWNGKHIIHMVRVTFLEIESNFHNIGHIHNTWEDYMITRAIGISARSAPPPEVINVHWWPPSAPWIKVNTDGSALGAPGKIAAGGVFRDNWAWVRGCFHVKGGVGYAFEAELLAITHAIRIAHNRGWLYLWIESDSVYIVKILANRSCNVPWRFIAAWREILRLLPESHLQVTHIYREGNKVADIMANDSREEACYWSSTWQAPGLFSRAVGAENLVVGLHWMQMLFACYAGDSLWQLGCVELSQG
ncbi:uncharacterized protein LOC131008050 [Salvia miltiorrhiza]|uniref:uncharacterized protein LOC131008050 n=1 Tax=Salvia miltiorrhiza TaxID=226208 RepID=UPI0025ABEF84|nr:uncharacterized protein LOC131008050 [Salvia miltiorrhiza]